MIANGPAMSPACRGRSCLGVAMAYETLVVPEITTGAEPATPVPVIAVVCGNTDAIPWTSRVIGDRPYAKVTGVMTSKARDASGSTTRAPENASPYGFNTSFKESVAAGVWLHGSPATSRLPPAAV